MRLRNVSFLILMIGLVACLQSTAFATTLDLRAAALGGGTMIHGWGFDGADVTTAGGDITGNLNALVEMSTGTGAGMIGYNAAGYDASSKSSSTYNDPLDGGFGGGNANYFHTSAGIAPPSTFSWEVLLKTDYVPIVTTPDDRYNLGYVIAHRPAGNRGYFLWQGSSYDIDTLNGGDSFTSLTGGWQTGEATVVPAVMPAQNWYYMAGTYTVSAGAGSPSTVDLYVADLTAGDTVLTHLPTFADPGSYEVGVAGTFGIGGRMDASPEAFPGWLDEVYLHEVALSANALQGHLDALLVPEPSTFVLLALGALCLVWRRRK